MIRPRLACTLIATLALGTPGTLPVQAKDRDKQLEKGIRLVETGAFKEAVAELTDAGRRLSREPERRAEAAQAFLYAGLAYVGLGETSPAISQFAQALMRDPKVQIPPERESPPAKDAFEVARREAVAPPEPKGRSKTPFIVAGVAVVAGGAAVAAGGGGSDGGSPASTLPAVFTVTTGTGQPQLLLLSAVPPAGSTIDLRQTAPGLSFTFLNQANLPARVRATAELLGTRGNCITGRTSEVTRVDPSVNAYNVIVNSWLITCTGSFTTTSMNVRLIDADADIPVSLTSYSGGYVFQQ